MSHLVRLVFDDGWTVDTAAAQLRHRIRKDSVLRRVRARVARVTTERATPIGERAVATINAALALHCRSTPPLGWRLSADVEVARFS